MLFRAVSSNGPTRLLIEFCQLVKYCKKIFSSQKNLESSKLSNGLQNGFNECLCSTKSSTELRYEKI